MLEIANEYTSVSKYTKDAYAFMGASKPKVVAKPQRILKSSHDAEELQRLRELSDSQLGQHRLPDQDNFKDKARQLGKPLHSSEFIRRVKKLSPGIIVEDSINCKGHVGFYYMAQDGTKKYTNASLKKGILTEFSVVETDAADLPVRVQYGWREVLLRLARAGCISEAQVLRMFGAAETVQSTAWRRGMQSLRR